MPSGREPQHEHDRDPDHPRKPSRNRGPWTHRAGVFVSSVVLGILAFWLLGFVIDDIGSWPGPDYAKLETQMLDPVLVASARSLEAEIAATKREIEDQRRRQTLLRDSSSSSQQTMNQLLNLQRLRLEKGVAPLLEEQEALAESERLFLTKQTQYQQINEDIVRLEESLRDLEESQRASAAALAEKREPIREAYQVLRRRHDLKMAGIKLAVLAPLLVVALLLFVKKRRSVYAPLINAFSLAVLVEAGFVMHEYFPARYFKYVLIIAALLAVGAALVFLLRMVAHPRKDWLLKQYREAYERFLCPVCSYPIRRGPLKYMVWSRRRIRNLPVAAAPIDGEDEPYTCPMCGTCLYEACGSCGTIRASLLPSCERCGASREPSHEE